MKNTLLLILLAFFMGCDTKDLSLNVITFNIRNNNPGDGINIWDARIPIVKSYLTAANPDTIGMQEVMHRQVLDLQDLLEDYAFDYIFVSDPFEVDAYQIDRIMDGKVFISDNWPVEAKISFKIRNIFKK